MKPLGLLARPHLCVLVLAVCSAIEIRLRDTSADAKAAGTSQQRAAGAAVAVPHGGGPAETPGQERGGSTAPLGERPASAGLLDVGGGALLDESAMREVEAELALETTLSNNLASQILKVIFGTLFLMVAIAIQWFNEERSVRINTLLVRGQSECITVSDPQHPSEHDRGRLVHVQGRTRSMSPLADNQFKDAEVRDCLKLQSTVEVFEWVQTTKTWVEGSEKRHRPRFHTEWTTIHQDSHRFKKPSPDNPRLPGGLALGTSTKVSSRVELGGFVLTSDMLKHFHRFEPAIGRLPDRVTAHGLTFVANREDGYYYSRPGSSARSGSNSHLFSDHKVGDMRVRFMCVPEGNATVVAVQCEKDGSDSFVPYRPITRGPCISEFQERMRLIEEGDRSLKELKREVSCCSGGVASCCCCACNAIALCCKEEVVTEEIFYVSANTEPADKAFQWVVQRNPCRVWNFRLLGWGTMLLGTGMVQGPLTGWASSSLSLRALDGVSNLAIAAAITLSISTMILAIANLAYRPLMALRWMIATAIVLAVPFVWDKISD